MSAYDRPLPLVSVVTPVRNEAATVDVFHERLSRALSSRSTRPI